MAKTQTALERAIDTRRIEKTELEKYDIYFGSAADLIAAGVVRADQFPPEGKRSICYLNGKVIRGQHKYDETYLRIDRWRNGSARVEIGVSVDVARARKAAAAAERVARSEAYLRQELAAALAAKAPEIDAIKRTLRNMPASANDFRREFVSYQRMLLNVGLKTDPLPSHGYSFSDEAKDQIRLSLDALVEAVISAEVRFDAALHQQIKQGHRAKLAAIDPGFQESLKRLTKVDHRVLQGAAS